MTRWGVVVAACAAVGVGLVAHPTHGAGPELVPVRVLVQGLDSPVQAVPAPSRRQGRLFVVEQGGRILIADGHSVLKRPFLDLRSVVAHGGLRGLLSLAFHPKYVSNGLAYVYYVGRDGAIYLAEIKTAGGYAASRRVLLRIAASRAAYAHFGGDLAFGPDGRLYVSVGDGGDPRTAQDPGTLLGKIIRLRPQARRGSPEIVAWGLRNPWRFSFTTDGAALVIGDVGGNRREEIDLVPRRLYGRANLGWPLFEGTARTGHGDHGLRGVLMVPYVEYRHKKHRCYSVVGGVVYRGSRFPDLRGRYVFGDLCGGMWSVRLRGPLARRVREEPFATSGGILTSLSEGSDHELLFVGGNGIIDTPVPR